MYERRRYRVEEFAIPLTEGPMRADALIDTVSMVKSLCENLAIEPSDLDQLYWDIEGWPTRSDPNHLVIRFILREQVSR